MEQRTPEWFALRKKLLTASDIAAVLRLDPYKSPMKVFDLKVGDSEVKINSDMQRGIDSEETAREAYEAFTGFDVKEAGLYVHQGINWLGASPDGLIDDPNEEGKGLLEIKCPRTVHQEVPLHYLCQIQTQLEVCSHSLGDYNYCDFYSWTASDSIITRVYKDQRFWNEIFPTLEDFWVNNVQKKIRQKRKANGKR